MRHRLSDYCQTRQCLIPQSYSFPLFWLRLWLLVCELTSVCRLIIPEYKEMTITTTNNATLETAVSWNSEIKIRITGRALSSKYMN